MRGRLQRAAGLRAASPRAARRSRSSGPQVSYFAPQILMEQEIHAPAGRPGPPIDARGAAFPGTNLYVQLGHGRDYAWSATSAGQDIIDTFAVRALRARRLEADASSSMSYRFRGQCLPIDVLERDQLLDPVARRPDAVGLGDLPRRAHRARDRHPPGARSRASRTPSPSCAPPTSTRSTRRSASPTSTTPRRWSRRRSSCRRRARSTTPSTGSTSTTSTSPTSTPGSTRCARSARIPTCRPRASASSSGGTASPPSQALLSGGADRPDNVDPRTNISDAGAVRDAPADRRPEATSRAGTTSRRAASAPPTTTSATARSTARLRLDERIRGADHGQREAITPPELVDAMEDAGTVDLRGDVGRCPGAAR